MATPHPLEEETQLAPGNQFDPYKTPRAPGAFAGFFSEENAYLSPVLAGAGQGAAYIEQGLGTLLRGAGRIYASVGQPRAVGLELPQVGASIEQDARDRIKALTPNANTTGAATQIVSGLASGAYRATVGSLTAGPAGAATVLGTTSAQQRYQELTEQGVSPKVAATLAGVAGIANAAGALLPAGVGSTLLSRVGSGGAGNVGFGLLTRYTDHETLEENGYHEMAQQQKVWDAQSVLADLLLGGTFGAIAHVQARGEAKAATVAALREIEQRLGRGSPGAQDAGLALSLAAADDRSGPGVPVDPAASAAHAAALEQAQVDLERGRPVNVAGTGVEDSTVARRPAADLGDVQAMLMRELQNGGFGHERDELARLEASMGQRLGEQPRAQPSFAEEDRVAPPAGVEWEIPRDNRLEGEDKEIESRFVTALQADYEGMRDRYNAIPDTAGGKIMSVDTARELSPDYIADRTKSEAVHEPASAFIKRLYAERLAQAPGPGEEPLVLFMGGGTGAGKSTAIKEALGPVARRAQLIYDTNLNGTASSVKKIDQALTAGKNVEIVGVYREPVEALTGGALHRAMRQESEFGSGRTVPIEAHVNTHVGFNSTIREIAEHYKGDDRVRVSVIDNTRGRGNAQQIDIAAMPRVDYNRAREESYAALEQARSAGTISEPVYRGFRGAAGAELAPVRSASAGPAGAAGPAANGAGSAAAEPGAGARPEPQQERAGGRPNELTDERGKAEAKPGQPFLAFRAAAGGSKTLAGRNAGNADSVAAFLQRLEQGEGPVPAGTAGKPPTTITVYRVESPQGFELYRAMNRGEPGVGGKATATAGRVGREFREREGVVYSFGKGGDYRAEPVATVSVDELREALKAKGFDSIDDAGAKAAAETLRELAASKMQPTHMVQTATGRQVEVRPRVVEASDLVTSDQEAYPKELQPRQRGARAALTEQVSSIARNLNPEMLGNAPEADRGAPIVGPGNVVESGNGRVFALRDAFQNQPQGAAAYRKFLKDQGYDVSGFKQPVLVRERVTPMSDQERRAFTVEANQTSVAALSPVERAAADSRLLDGAVLSQLRNGDIASGQNASFVRSFLQKIPEGERNAMVNPDGTVSQEGVRRLQAAILGKAYGGTPESNAVLGRLLESTDNDMRSTMGAMLDAAPAFAKLRQAIEDGKVGPEYDLSRALTQAIETTARVRESGQALGEFLKQEDFLTRRLPVVDQLMRVMHDKGGERLAGREKVAQALMNYADRALKQRLDQGMLFGDRPASPEQLLTPPKEPERQEMRPATDMFGLRGKPAEGADQAARQVVASNPNLEVPSEDGEMVRARAELIANAEGVEKAEQRAPDALSIAANCFGQRAA